MSVTTEAEAANGMRWLFQAGHSEVWYATLSDPQTRTGFWIRYTLEAPLPGHGAPSARLWFARFSADHPAENFGVSVGYDIADLRHQSRPFRVSVGDAELRMDGMRGRVVGDGHEASWELRWTPATQPLKVLPSAVYALGVGDTQVLSPNIDVHATGTIVVDGKTYALDGAPLGQSHLWGKKHAYSWAWGHCNAFDERPGLVLETLTVRLRRGPLVTPALTMLAVWENGAPLVELREPWHLVTSRSAYETGRYVLSGATPTTKVEVEFHCRPEDMIVTEYADPDGEAAWCHNTEAADATLTISKRAPLIGSWHETLRVRSTKMAHFEWAARAGDRLVTRKHVAV